MINILSYVGMNMQAEVCLWTLLGLVRTIFDATLFKVNANLKQVWQMSMPVELSMSVQRVLRTMISGIMLVQCFTVYVYLASYIVLLYPVFLEEHPALVLPWLLLAAVRKLLCELTSLAVGLGTCVLLGNAKPPCIKFLIIKICSIMPAFYMWLLIYSYYHALKVASAFKTFPALIPPNDPDYGLELAVRRRRTKSLFTEEDLRKKLVAGFYADRSTPCNDNIPPRTLDSTILPADANDSGSSIDVSQADREILQPLSGASHRNLDAGTFEDSFGKEIVIPRGDRILEQFITMLLRIGAYLNKDEGESINSHMFNSTISAVWTPCDNIEAMSVDETDTPPSVANSKGHTASYLREYPQIFMKKLSSETPQPDVTISQIHNTECVLNSIKGHQKSESNVNTLSEIEKNISAKTISLNITKISDYSISNRLELSQPDEIEKSFNFNKEKANKVVLPEREIMKSKSSSFILSPETFFMEIINSCFETIFNSLQSLTPGRTQQNLISSIASSQEIALYEQEVPGQRQESRENFSKPGDENKEVDALVSHTKTSEGEPSNKVLKNEHKEAVTDGSASTSNRQVYQRDIRNTDDISSSKKLKKD